MPPRDLYNGCTNERACCKKEQDLQYALGEHRDLGGMRFRYIGAQFPKSDEVQRPINVLKLIDGINVTKWMVNTIIIIITSEFYAL